MNQSRIDRISKCLLRRDWSGLVMLTAMLGLVLIAGSALAQNEEEELDEARVPSNRMYVQTGNDPSFASLMRQKAIPVGRNSDEGIRGSHINVNNAYLDRLRGEDFGIAEELRIHTIGHSAIRRKDFDKWSRWYQEDGNTQIFRMFEGEHNIRNDRPDAGRIESFTNLDWKRGEWHAWEGMYTIVKPHTCMIFQAKNSDNDWGVAIMMYDNGDIKIKHRVGQDDEYIARGMTGKSFLLGIRDNGHDYEVYYNNEKVAEGSFNRPKGFNNFRWGMYGGTFEHDAMIFVTGVRYE